MRCELHIIFIYRTLLEEQMQNQQAKTLLAFHNYCLVGLATEIDAGSAKKTLYS